MWKKLEIINDDKSDNSNHIETGSHVQNENVEKLEIIEETGMHTCIMFLALVAF